MNYKLSMVVVGLFAGLLTGCNNDDDQVVDAGGDGAGQIIDGGNNTGDGNGTDGGNSSGSLEAITEFAFTITEQKIAVGKSTEYVEGKCAGNVNEADNIGDINIYSVLSGSGNNCYTSGTYNNLNYPVVLGLLSAGETQYEAYRVSHAQTLAKQWVASSHNVRMKFAATGDYAVYGYNVEVNNFYKMGEVNAAAIDEYVPLPINIDALERELIFTVLPLSAERPSTLNKLGENVEGAYLSTMSEVADINLYRLQLDGTVMPKEPEDFTAGPSEHNNTYSLRHAFSNFGLSDGSLGTIWQDKANYQYYFTRLFSSQKSHTIELPAAQDTGDFELAGATADEQDNLYYLLIEAGKQSHNLIAWLVKSDLNGNVLLKKDVTTIIDDLQHFSVDEQAVLKVLGNQLGVFYSGVHQNGHQWAEFEIFDTETLDLIKDHGQTASHSFGLVLTTTKDNSQFLTLDLGDNYPRGILLSRFDDTSRAGAVVYSYKTYHKEGATNTNDNRTYTELGGLVDTGNGYLVFFASEHDANGKVLDNSQATGSNLNAARNLGVVKVVPDFTSGSMEISDDLMMLTGDYPAEVGSYLNFYGTETLQRVTGIRWLTQFDPTNLERNVSRLKAVTLPEKQQVLLLWEEWTKTDYITTKFMIVDFDANQVGEIYELENIRVHRRDELLYKDGSVWLVTGKSHDHSIQLLEFKLL